MMSLNAEQVRQHLPMPLAIESMGKAFRAISSGCVNLPKRTHLDLPRHHGTTLVMPAHVDHEDIESLSVKVATVFADNPSKGLATVFATMFVLDPETGNPKAILDGAELTAIRTAAASAAATEVLSRSSCPTLALIGTGVQARAHLEAIQVVRKIDSVLVFSRNSQKCQSFVDDSQQRFPHIQFEPCDCADDAVSRSDIVCTLTSSSHPVFNANAIRPGTHLNVVGSHQPHAAEVPPETVAAARVFVDHLESAVREAGDLIQPMQQGLFDRLHILGEIGEVLLGKIEGRLKPQDITLFKSVGNAVEDSIAAHVVVESAERTRSKEIGNTDERMGNTDLP